jgi:hypothetical protein
MTTTHPDPPDARPGVLTELDQPLSPDKQDPRHQELDAKRREYADEICRLADLFGRAGIIEDGVYRFYHQSFKISHLLAMANEAYALLKTVCATEDGRLRRLFPDLTRTLTELCAA